MMNNDVNNMLVLNEGEKSRKQKSGNETKSIEWCSIGEESESDGTDNNV